MLKLIIIYFMFEIGLAQNASVCDDWLAYQDEKCIKVFDDTNSEIEEENLCKIKNQDAIISIIKTKEEQVFIEKYLKEAKISDDIWVGLKKSNNIFKWTDGTEPKYTNWAEGRPLKNSPEQNCVTISVDDSTFGKWFDVKCNKKMAVLCERIQSWSIIKLQNILLEERRIKTEEINNLLKLLNEEKQKLNDYQQKTDSEITHIKSNLVPIGFIYIQLSTQSEPKTLWPNTEWQNISPKYGGLFFRAEGGQSVAFGQTQEQQSQSLDVRWDIDFTNNDSNKAWQKWYRVPHNEEVNSVYTGSNSGDNIYLRLKFNNEEIRPTNQAIRIWMRTK